MDYNEQWNRKIKILRRLVNTVRVENFRETNSRGGLSGKVPAKEE